jgi:hypothetical protein
MGVLDIVAPPSAVRAPPTPLHHQTATTGPLRTWLASTPTPTGLTQIDAARTTFRGKLNAILGKVNLQAISGYSSITAGTPARVNLPGFGLKLGQVLEPSLGIAASNQVSGPAAGRPNAYTGPIRHGFAVKVG